MQKIYAKLNKGAGNRGFSLIELIIVIAIMAVLIGILAPQYLKYVERSRVSADQTSLDEIAGAVRIYATEEDANIGDTLTYTGTAGELTAADTGITPSEVGIDSDTLTLKSKQGKTVESAEFEITSGSGVTVTLSEVAAADEDYKTWTAS